MIGTSKWENMRKKMQSPIINSTFLFLHESSMTFKHSSLESMGKKFTVTLMAEEKHWVGKKLFLMKRKNS